MKFFNLRFLSFLLIAFVSVTGLRAQATMEKPKVEHYTLSNGLTVIIQEDHRLPKVQGFVATRAGSLNDPADATGLAHYLEHMLFKGTTEMGTTDWTKEKPHYDKIVALYDQLGQTKDKKQRAAIQQQINEESLAAAQYAIPNELTKMLDNIGGTAVNAYTTYDHTAYHSAFPSSQVERWLTIYSHIFMHPVFRSFQAELETVYEEFNMYSDRATEQLNDEVMKNLFKKTPYGRPVIGYGDHLKNPSLTRLQEFYNTYYVPGNMVLVLCGDVDAAAVKPMIENTFGKWEAKPVAKENVSAEDPFKGRELQKIKLGTYDMIRVNYRAANDSDKDALVLDICSSLLFNGQSGLLDELTMEAKVLQAVAINGSLKGSGIFSMILVPNANAYYEGQDLSTITTAEEYKNVRRQLDQARLKAINDGEKILTTQAKRLADGDFPDWLLTSVKNTMINNYVRSQESISSRAQRLMRSFLATNDVKDYVNYIDRVNAIDKAEIMRVAKKYFGADYMVFQIAPGRAKKDNIEKPGYKALEFPNAEKNSVFAESLYKMASPEQKISFIDFANDVKVSTLKNGTKLHYTPNPVNSIFSLTLRYGAGTEKIKLLNYIQLLNAGAAGAWSARDFKARLAALNCTLSVMADESYTYVVLGGPDENFNRVLALLNSFVNGTNLSKTQVSRWAESLRYERKEELEEPAVISDALEQYVMYGEKSEYIDRLSIKELRQMKPNDIVNAFKDATQYEADIFYTGTLAQNQVTQQLQQTLKMAEQPRKSDGLIIKERNKLTDNIVYLVNESSLQSQIGFFANGKVFELKDQPAITAFNQYFSSGFTGIVLQELRENRSLAYGAGAYYVRPALTGKPSYFTGGIQTQGDKTNVAVDAFMDLIRNMPQKADRLNNLKQYLKLSAVNRPDFRQYAMSIDSWKQLGYTDDPLKTLLPQYESLTFDTITGFWSQEVKPLPIATMIVGNKKQMDTKGLQKYGKITELKTKDIFSKDEE